MRERIVKGRYVIDEEYIVGLPADDPHVSVIIYEVRDGRIRNAWFIEDWPARAPCPSGRASAPCLSAESPPPQPIDRPPGRAAMRILHLACAVLLAACTAGPRAPAAREPERVVQALYDAFNRRDVGGMMAAYASDAVFIDPPVDTIPLDTGQLRGFYERQFELLPRMRMEVRERRVDGRTVVDEVVTRDGPCKGPDTVTITYEVVDGRIRSVTEAPPTEQMVAVSIVPGWHVSCPASTVP